MCYVQGQPSNPDHQFAEFDANQSGLQFLESSDPRLIRQAAFSEPAGGDDAPSVWDTYERACRSLTFDEFAEFGAGNSAGASSRKALSRDDDGAPGSAIQHYLDPHYIEGTQFFNKAGAFCSLARGEDFPSTPDSGPKPSWGFGGKAPDLSRDSAPGTAAEGADLSSLDTLKNNRNKTLAPCVRLESVRDGWEPVPGEIELDSTVGAVYFDGAYYRRPLGRDRFCGRLCVTGIDSKTGRKLYRRVNCNGWRCSYCGPRRARTAKASIRSAADKFGLRYFLTLTLDPKKLKDKNCAVPHLRHVWSMFRTYLKRKYGQCPSYICVLEYTQSGRPHLHVLLDRYIPQAWISTVWSILGGGKIVDIRRVTIKNVSRYLSKYLTKDMLCSAPKGARRITSARSIKLFPKFASGIRWRLLKLSLWAVLKRKRARMAAQVQAANPFRELPLFGDFKSSLGVEQWLGRLGIDRHFKLHLDEESFLAGFEAANFNLRKEAICVV